LRKELVERNGHVVYSIKEKRIIIKKPKEK
jgi:hypothetical protein